MVAPAARERLADDLLGLPARVHIGGVYEVDAGVERPVDDADGDVVIALAPGAEHHRSQTQRGHLDAGPGERAPFHAQTLDDRGITHRIGRRGYAGWPMRLCAHSTTVSSIGRAENPSRWRDFSAE